MVLDLPDPYHWITDAATALYFSGFQDANKNEFFFLITGTYCRYFNIDKS